MQAGKLDQRLEILRAAVTQNDFNEDEETFPVLATRWASRKDVSDGEKAAAGTILSTLSTRFQVRHDSVTETITPEDRVRCEGLTFNVVGVKRIGRREGIEITANARLDT